MGTVRATALIVYEYLITLGPEIRLFWCRKFTTATVLFHLNRQITLLTCWFQVVWTFYGTTTIEVCSSVMKVSRSNLLFSCRGIEQCLFHWNISNVLTYYGTARCISTSQARTYIGTLPVLVGAGASHTPSWYYVVRCPRSILWTSCPRSQQKQNTGSICVRPVINPGGGQFCTLQHHLVLPYDGE